MAVYLGIDTSNYTTSTALYDSDTGEIRQSKRLLPVKEGQLGLRQSDAVFAHVKALGGLMEELMEGFSGRLCAVGVSVSPRDEEGSYMPCFLTGEMAARSVAAVQGVPLYRFSHQAGHCAAALFATDRLELLQAPFLAFHISGGTTQCVYVEPGKNTLLSIATVSQSLDLHAGQVVDRVGAMLGLSFPAGPALEQMALTSDRRYTPKPTFRDGNCCLSGLENQCRAQMERGEEPQDVARFCLDALGQVLLEMTEQAVKKHPGLPLLYAGGVMSNRIIRETVEKRFDCTFAPPAFSTDNAAGTAVLCKAAHEGALAENFQKKE